MTTIKNISVTKTTHAELTELANHYIDIIKTHLPDNTLLIALAHIIQPKSDNLHAALAAIRTNSLVQEVFELDQIRDNAFVVFRTMIAAYEKTDITKEKEAYDQLSQVIDKIGTQLYVEGYVEQSGKLETLFIEMDKQENKEAMHTLDVISRYTKLKTAEQNFKTQYSNRLAEDAKKDYPTIKESRGALTPLITDLIPTLRNVIRTADKGSDLGWAALINEQNEKIMTQIAARRTRKSNDQVEVLE